jgi:redox-sensitive bicupin YhaK (pirin superfamily)
MLTIRKSADRGYADHGWLKSFHSFSFADYHDQRHMNFGALRVINEDWVAAGQGFGTHPHRDMEIVTYVLEGALEHKDSLGTGSIIRPGDVQRMTAGTGIQHSEFNPSNEQATHLLQIWIVPKFRGLPPSYEQQNIDPASKLNQLRLIAAPDGENGAVTIHQDARIYASVLDGQQDIRHPLGPVRQAYVQVVRGQLRANGIALEAGDALMLQDEAELHLSDAVDAECLVFDLARP